VAFDNVAVLVKQMREEPVRFEAFITIERDRVDAIIG